MMYMMFSSLILLGTVCRTCQELSRSIIGSQGPITIFAPPKKIHCPLIRVCLDNIGLSLHVDKLWPTRAINDL